jgi:hypothetical protein
MNGYAEDSKKMFWLLDRIFNFFGRMFLKFLEKIINKK